MAHKRVETQLPGREAAAPTSRTTDADVMRRRAERAESMLEYELQIRETILWHLPILFVTTTANAEVLFANARASAILAMSSREVVAKPFLELFVAEDWREIVTQQLAALAGSDRPLVFECPLGAPSADPAMVEWHALRLAGADGEPDLVIFAGVERGANGGNLRQLRERQRMHALGQLTAGVAHGFNNLLQSIQGNVSLMLAEIDEFVDDEVQRGAGMTRTLLDAAGVNPGGLRVGSLDLNERVRLTAEMFSTARRDLSVELELAAGLGLATGSVSDLDQVILDVLIHAASHLRRGGRITVRSMGEGGTDGGTGDSERLLLLLVEDSGPFAMPVGADRRWTGARHAAGPRGLLGLEATAQLVSALGGELRSFTDPRRGNTVRLLLPASGEPAPEHSGTPDPVDQQQEISILLVDDEGVMRDVGRRLLGRLGYRVTTAAGGREGLSQFNRQPDFALVILDLVMPDLPGREVLAALLEARPGLQVLIASGYSADSEAQQLIDMGAVGFLQKPFRLSELERVVTALVGQPAGVAPVAGS